MVGQLHDAEAWRRPRRLECRPRLRAWRSPGMLTGCAIQHWRRRRAAACWSARGTCRPHGQISRCLTIAEHLGEADPENADLAARPGGIARKDWRCPPNPRQSFSRTGQFPVPLSPLSIVWRKPILRVPTGRPSWQCRKARAFAGGVGQLRAAHAIADRSAETDPRNASWQLDLAMPHDKIGDVLAQQNELAVALKSFSCVCANWLPATRRFRKTWPGSRSAWQS